MVTFFQTITGLIGQKVDGSQQGGGGGDNPNPPIVNDPRIAIAGDNLTFNVEEIPGSEPDYAVNLSPYTKEITGLQDQNSYIRYTITAAGMDQIRYSSPLSYTVTGFSDLTETQYNVLAAAAELKLMLEIVNNSNVVIATSNQLTFRS